ncbi:sensor histidine kinase [Alicyclobacillus fastidiosus]|uniref:histidine kinase n=1 Tax=Alicyclobacillus fastidiosus TaxID=392011 RepID=A0ABV5AGF9_9BACL|nr:HAMP domain-containing sensor histidine kinase [Alicyclobacillus fastidiosus]WEH08968.1 HAMP domain-containing sensor histidine kinase [Alicyclobacillus fastidiosus]
MTKHVGFSLRTKVLSIFLATVASIMLLSNFLYYETNKQLLLTKLRSYNQFLNSQLNDEVNRTSLAQNDLDGAVNDKLKSAAITLEYALPPRADEVTNQSLVALANKLGVSGFTLFQIHDGYAEAVKSSDPTEAGQRFKLVSGSEWVTAFLEISEGKPVDVQKGTASSHFWIGPWAKDKVNPSRVDKYGYYFDGSTDYVIDPFQAQQQASTELSANKTVEELMTSDKSILSIAGINPLTFGKAPKLTKSTNGTSYVDLSDESIAFGQYRFADGRDKSAVQRAYRDKTTVVFTATQDHRKVIKTFVYQSGDTYNSTPYVTEIVTDYQAVEHALRQELNNSIRVSLMMMFAVLILSYLCSGYIVRPLQRLTKQVEQIAHENFDVPVDVQRSDEIGELAKSVNILRENLLESLHRTAQDERSSSMRYLGMMAASLIHELRTPAITIRYLFDLIHRCGLENEKSKEALSRVESSTAHLIGIIDSFSNYIKNGRLDLAYKNIVEIIQETIEVYQPTAQQAGVNLHFVGPESQTIWVHIDAEKVRMVLINLLKNGVESMKDARDKQLIVHLQCVNSTIVVDITDHGPGIPEEKWTDIFTPFRSDKERGLGLGLSLSALIVLSHGGTIYVADSTADGTTIRVTLPQVSQGYTDGFPPSHPQM